MPVILRYSKECVRKIVKFVFSPLEFNILSQAQETLEGLGDLFALLVTGVIKNTIQGLQTCLTVSGFELILGNVCQVLVSFTRLSVGVFKVSFYRLSTTKKLQRKLHADSSVSRFEGLSFGLINQHKHLTCRVPSPWSV